MSSPGYAPRRIAAAALLLMLCGLVPAAPVAHADGVPPGSMVGYLQMGEVWVSVEDAVSAGNNPFVRIDDAASGAIGGFRSDADGGDAIQWTSATFVSSTSGAGFAKLSIRK